MLRLRLRGSAILEPEPLSEPIPSAVGRYEIRREIGRGMMGVVYEAFDPALGRNVALKTIHLAFPVTPDEGAAFEQRFLSEARIAGRLSHPGIVVVHDAGRDPQTGTLFIAMECLQGRTLAHPTPEPPLDWRDVLRLGGRLADALQHAHAAGVIHRDVKPANIMVLPSGEPKIMDFGIAKVETGRLRITATGQSFGTPLYMSPEQALGEEVDARTDQFSLGAILYWMLTGRLAFGAESMMAIIGKVLHQDPPPPSQVRPGVPAEVDYVVGRCLAKDPRARYATSGALAEDIADVLAGLPPRHRATAVPKAAERTGTLPGKIPPRLRFAKTGLSALVAGTALFVLTATAFLVARRHPPSPSTASSATHTGPEASPSSGLGALLSAFQGEKPAELAIDVEHPLRVGLLKLWLDGQLVKEEKLGGHVTKKVMGLKLRKGSFHDVLAVKPGRHEIQVQVSWDDGARTERISGTFNPGAARRLQVSLGRVLKDLTLEWK